MISSRLLLLIAIVLLLLCGGCSNDSWRLAPAPMLPHPGPLRFDTGEQTEALLYCRYPLGISYESKVMFRDSNGRVAWSGEIAERSDEFLRRSAAWEELELGPISPDSVDDSDEVTYWKRTVITLSPMVGILTQMKQPGAWSVFGRTGASVVVESEPAPLYWYSPELNVEPLPVPSVEGERVIDIGSTKVLVLDHSNGALSVRLRRKEM